MSVAWFSLFRLHATSRIFCFWRTSPNTIPPNHQHPPTPCHARTRTLSVSSLSAIALCALCVWCSSDGFHASLPRAYALPWLFTNFHDFFFACSRSFPAWSAVHHHIRRYWPLRSPHVYVILTYSLTTIYSSLLITLCVLCMCVCMVGQRCKVKQALI